MHLAPHEQVLVIAAGIEIFIICCIAFSTWPHLGAATILASITVQAFALQPPSVTVGVTIYLPDIAFLAMLVLSVLRIRLQDRHSSSISDTALLVLGLMFGINLIRGILTYGIQTAVNESRFYLYFIAGAMFYTSMRPTADLLRKLWEQWLAFALGLSVIAVIFWVSLAIGAPYQAVWSRQAIEWGNSPLRVLSVQQAMFLASALLVSLGIQLNTQEISWQRRVWLVALPTVTLLTHRTVWIAVMVGFAVLLLTSEEMRRRLGLILPGVILVAVAGVAVVGGLIANASAVVNLLTDTTTFAWRIESVRLLVDDFRLDGLFDMLIGRPFGAGFERDIAGSTVDVQPHNFYVQTLLSLGLLGLVLFILLYGSILRNAHWTSRQSEVASWLSPPTVVALAVGQLVFFITYGATVEMGMMVGILLGVEAALLAEPHGSRAPSTTGRVAPHPALQRG